MCPSSPSLGRIPPSLSCASASASLPSSRRTPSLPPPQKKRPILPCYARSPSPAPLAPFFSLALPLAHSTKKKTNPLAWVHVLMHSTGPVHHQSSLLPFLSLRTTLLLVIFLLSGFLRCQHPWISHIVRYVRPPYSPPFGRRNMGTHLHSSYICFLFRLGKMMNSVSRFSPSFVSACSRKTEPTHTGTRLTQSSGRVHNKSSPFQILSPSGPRRCCSAILVFSLPTATIYGRVTSWGTSNYLTNRRLVAGGSTPIFPLLMFLISCCSDFFRCQPPPSMDEGPISFWSSPTMLLDDSHNIETIGI